MFLALPLIKQTPQVSGQLLRTSFSLHLFGLLPDHLQPFCFPIVKKVPSVSKQVHPVLQVTGQFSAAPAIEQRSPALLLIKLQVLNLPLKTNFSSLSWQYELPVVGEVTGAFVGEDVTVAFVGAGVTGILVGGDVTVAFVGAGVTGVLVGAGVKTSQLSVACPVAYTKIRAVPGDPVFREQTLTVRVPAPDQL